MKKNEFILRAFKESRIWLKAEWCFKLFTVNESIEPADHPEPYDIAVIDDKYCFYLNDQQGWQVIEDAPNPKQYPIYDVTHTVIVPSQDFLIQPYDKFPFKTRAGNLFVNHYILVFPYGNKVPYQNGEMNIKKLEAYVSSRLKEIPKDGVKDPNYLYPDETVKFSTACTSLSGFSTISTPSASAYTVLPSPGIDKLRNELYTKYAGQLNDPVIAAKVDKILVDYDRAYQAQDPDGGFLNSDKLYEVARKKTLVAIGYEKPEVTGNSDGVFIKNSLSEGWDLNELPTMIDSLRDGSYNRGAMTALGGEAVKFIFRIFATSNITEDDCGTNIGIERALTKDNINLYVGNTAILPNNKQLLITDENKNTLIGKVLPIRSPATCRTSNANYCLTCMGQKLANNKHSLAGLASNVGSDMLYVFMKKMHGVATKTVEWDIEKTLF